MFQLSGLYYRDFRVAGLETHCRRSHSDSLSLRLELIQAIQGRKAETPR